MCSHCGTVGNYRKIIADNFDKIKKAKEKAAGNVEAAATNYGIDPCSANDVLLLEDIVFILEYLGIIDGMTIPQGDADSYSFKEGMTVKELKAILKDWPEEDADGNLTEVWAGTGENLSSPVTYAGKLNGTDLIFETNAFVKGDAK